jgi:hypothetical protein
MENQFVRRSNNVCRILLIAGCAILGNVGCAADPPPPPPTDYVPSFDRTFLDGGNGDRFFFERAEDADDQSGMLSGRRVPPGAQAVLLSGSFSDRDISFEEDAPGLTYTGTFVDDNTIVLHTFNRVTHTLKRDPPF